jgi:hypothetical protein
MKITRRRVLASSLSMAGLTIAARPTAEAEQPDPCGACPQKVADPDVHQIGKCLYCVGRRHDQLFRQAMESGAERSVLIGEVKASYSRG